MCTKPAEPAEWIIVPLDIHWQEQKAAVLRTGDQICRVIPHQHKSESYVVRADTMPTDSNVYDVVGDGNCLFRTVAYAVFGDEAMHCSVRSCCLLHMHQHWDRELMRECLGRFERETGYTLQPQQQFSSEEYIHAVGMDRTGVSGGSGEWLALSRVLQTCIAVSNFDKPELGWTFYGQRFLDSEPRTLLVRMTSGSTEVYGPSSSNHFQFVKVLQNGPHSMYESL